MLILKSERIFKFLHIVSELFQKSNDTIYYVLSI